MAKPYGVLRDVLDLAIQTGAPLAVRLRCSPHQLAVWMAIRFLIDTTDRTALGVRDIAEAAGLASYPRVAGWIDDLVELGFLEIVGHELVKGGKHDRPVYRIPWKPIFETSLSEAEKWVAKKANKRSRGRPPESHELQLPLEFPVIDGSRPPLPIDHGQPLPIDHGQPLPIDHGQPLPIDHGYRDPSITATVTDGSRLRDRSVTLDGWMDGSDGGIAPPAQKTQRRRATAAASPVPSADPDPPAPPPGQPPLSAHPYALWRAACPKQRPIDSAQLDALAADHDAPTSGHGVYWLGRAILACSLTEDIRGVGKVRNALDRWRREDAYGSDLPRRKEAHGRQASTDRAERSAGAAGGRAVRAGPAESGPERTLDPDAW